MKSILLAGCNGRIGSVLYEELKGRYRITPCDIRENNLGMEDFRRVDFCDYQDVQKVMEELHYDAVISLIGLEEAPQIPEPDLFGKMLNTYLLSTYNILHAMKNARLDKLILASSNHVTDCYEQDGYSLLGREITPADYPTSKSAYGSLKLAAESLCENFYHACGIKSVCFRIGTFRPSLEGETPNRFNRTILTKEDLVRYYVAAIENPEAKGVYYLVSENKNKPWDTSGLAQLCRE